MPAKRIWTEAAILAAVQAFIARTGRAPVRRDFLTDGELPSLRVVEHHMRTWQEPVRQAQQSLPDDNL